MDLDKFFVPWIDRVKPYATDDINYAWSHPEIHRMFVNENPIPPSDKLVKAVTDAARMGNRYPDNGPRIRAKIAGLHGLDAENIYLSHGSSEIIDLMMRLFVAPGEEVIIPNPTFSLYEIRAANVGANVIKIDMTPELQYDTPSIIGAVTAKTKLIVVCSPNNPTGDFIPDDELLQILELGIPALIDEAYLEYHPERGSKAPLVRDYPNAVVAHTFSKAYGLAGIRCGYAVADARLIQVFRRIQIPWNISLLSLAAMGAALDEKEELARKARSNNESIDYICRELSKIRGIKAYYSHGNYVLVDATDAGVTSREVVDFLLKQGIMIKSFPPLRKRDGFFRISVGSMDENIRCVRLLAKFFDERRSHS